MTRADDTWASWIAESRSHARRTDGPSPRRFRFDDALSWLCCIALLAAYGTGSARTFAWANAVLFLPITWPALRRHAYSVVALQTSFGVLGIRALLR